MVVVGAVLQLISMMMDLFKALMYKEAAPKHNEKKDISDKTAEAGAPGGNPAGADELAAAITAAVAAYCAASGSPADKFVVRSVRPAAPAAHGRRTLL
jgi:hypothetical protein